MNFDELERRIRGRGNTVIGRGASSDAINESESELGVQFPDALREYLSRFGWLGLGHHEFFGLGEGVPTFLHLTDVAQWEQNESGCPLPRNLIPLLNDGGGNLYCMVTAEGSPQRGAIVFWDHDLGPGQAPDEYAPNLAAWLNDVLTSLEE